MTKVVKAMVGTILALGVLIAPNSTLPPEPLGSKPPVVASTLPPEPLKAGEKTASILPPDPLKAVEVASTLPPEPLSIVNPKA